eukprot:g3063.t1
MRCVQQANLELSFQNINREMRLFDFVHRELVLFSRDDNARSIPSAFDGFKPAQRKVLFAAFKRKLKKDIKVAQLAGYVSEHAAYHHGEASLQGTIVNMAQDFLGSNNLNLLLPSGQFGTRIMGGKDAASARYIFTRLNPVTRFIFREEDDAILNYLNDDGQSIEPEYYAPIIPMVLVNGADGIGTGWSTYVPCFNPLDVIENVRKCILEEDLVPMKPFFRGFEGTVEPKEEKVSSRKKKAAAGLVAQVTDAVSAATDGTSSAPIIKVVKAYTLRGKYEVQRMETINDVDNNNTEGISDEVRITELPVRKWTSDYKSFLETALEAHKKAHAAANPEPKDDENEAEAKTKKKKKTAGKKKKNGGSSRTVNLPAFTIKTFRENHTDVSVDFTLVFPSASAVVKKFGSKRNVDEIFKEFKLETSISLNNMQLFTTDGTIKHYNSPEDIIRDFYPQRLVLYQKRKANLVANAEMEYVRISNKARFIQMVTDSEITIQKKKKKQLVEELESLDFVKVDGSFDYLLSMPIYSLTVEKADQLFDQLDEKTEYLEMIRGKRVQDIWLEDLQELENAIHLDEEKRLKELEEAKQMARDAQQGGSSKKNKKKKGKGSSKSKGGKKKKATTANNKKSKKKKLQPWEYSDEEEQPEEDNYSDEDNNMDEEEWVADESSDEEFMTKKKKTKGTKRTRHAKTKASSNSSGPASSGITSSGTASSSVIMETSSTCPLSKDFEKMSVEGGSTYAKSEVSSVEALKPEAKKSKVETKKPVTATGGKDEDYDFQASEDDLSDDDSDSDFDIGDFGTTGGLSMMARLKGRAASKTSVSYKEDSSDDEDF